MRLTDIEVRQLKEEIMKKQEDLDLVNWDKLDSLVSRVKFFAKLPKPIRLLLLRYSEYYYFPRHSFVFKQGDYGDLMYVILRGSCNVRITRTTQYGTQEDVVVACLYDGDRFGELAMMGTTAKSSLIKQTDHISDLNTRGKSLEQQNRKRENQVQLTAQHAKKKEEETKQDENGGKSTSQQPQGNQEKPANYFERTKRAASIQIAESADLLAIPRDKFKEILLTMIQKELDVKLKVLQCLPFFHHMEPFSLIPLANNLTFKKYKFGEVIIREGDTPKELCIIVNGMAKVFKEVIDSRILKPSRYAKGRMPALKNFSITTRKESRFVQSINQFLRFFKKNLALMMRILKERCQKRCRKRRPISTKIERFNMRW